MKEKNDPMIPDGEVNPIDTDYQVGQDNIVVNVGPFGLDIHNRVFAVSGVMIIAFVVLTLLFQAEAEPFFGNIRTWLTGNLDGFFMGAANIFVILCLALVVSPLGRVRLGGTEAKPDYSYLGWFSMLFAAGMGIGLMYYGVSEPLGHFGTAFAGPTFENGVRTDYAPLAGAAGDAAAAQKLAMAATIYHWALHPWAIYAIMALGLALFSFNKGLPLTIRSVFYPILGERVWGWPGHIIDILAILATLFGLATSLGLGASQAASGLHSVFGLPLGETTEILLVLGITGLALFSVVAGLDAGVKKLSEINMILAVLLVFFVLVVGPTIAILTGFFDNIVSYFRYLPQLANPVGREDTGFATGWTAFYWAWWISWSPFVGMFIARVSRGRTVREFIISVLLVPSVACVFWMTVFGGTAIQQVVADGYQTAVNAELPLQLFAVLNGLPLASITSFIAIVLVIVFFVTSSDSGSLVIDVISAGGKVEAPTPQRVFWCVFEGLVAVSLILGGGLIALQAMAVSTGFPFTIVLLIAAFSMVKGLMSEPR
ncbi:BCCT family transporter [Paraglaciecola chathamensis]|jgi:BCCT family betaine/carnitine transporter|uniref:BCCT family transporter n=3 Tax=Paraglaciecola chathamensis TaxID=368405 RepID=A0A8H9M4X8_9ALTE|nr:MULTISPECIES: BCCT family transporter [Paraglaciecola]MBN26537.1 BCCT family transporter [Alteromonadaceae bacterium]MBJ2136270.1 BCCT family transporter [Paraglaciecola chathamensis]MBU3016534.1 BCCT family transporter [Paraglaciecola agarilytica]GAC06957.1 betaine/carnitine transporter, BCCT family [Paraglaciecola agarilytica NO2]GAC09506.1 betaine/carnitine transporter, BCCT family [Paraglaciecola chathamensis S18K6]|tara:strand:- start:58794 stop:60419 length:1626 start_codon:yes stop_codon:yes gene_type:complete